MYKMQLTLLAILAYFFSTMLYAQSSVDIKISGIDKSLEDNVRLFLSIEQQKNYVLMNPVRLRS